MGARRVRASVWAMGCVAPCCGPREGENGEAVELRPVGQVDREDSAEPLVTPSSNRRRCGGLVCCKRKASSGKEKRQIARNTDAPAGFVKGDAKTARSPTLEALSDKQSRLVTEMRAALAKRSKKMPERHDIWLKRFLAHGKWDLNKSLQLYEDMEAWRAQNGADTMLKRFPDGVGLRTLPMDATSFEPYGLDNIGRPIAIMTPGYANWWRPLYEPMEEMCRAQIWITEENDRRATLQAAEAGVWRERGVVLVDLSKLELAFFQGMLGSGRARKRSKTARFHIKNYPGLVDKAYIMNAPGFVNKMWAVVKLVLSQSLMEKACLVTTAADKEAMLQDLGRENVPRYLGGTSDAATMPYPLHLRQPSEGWKPVIEAWRPRELPIAAGGRLDEVVHVPTGKSLRWQWALLKDSINFEVQVRSLPAGDFQPLKASREVTFHDLEDPDIGETAAPAGAKSEGVEVRLSWDNSAWRMRSKTLILKLDIT